MTPAETVKAIRDLYQEPRSAYKDYEAVCWARLSALVATNVLAFVPLCEECRLRWVRSSGDDEGGKR